MTCLLLSCDPSKLIILKNKSDKPAYFTWIIEQDSVLSYSHYALKTGTLTLGTKTDEREEFIHFGFGAWPKAEIERFVNTNIKSIEIEGPNTKIKLTDKKEIIHFLSERRHGLLNNFITIKVY